MTAEYDAFRQEQAVSFVKVAAALQQRLYGRTQKDYKHIVVLESELGLQSS
jgi:hypothetical protein